MPETPELSMPFTPWQQLVNCRLALHLWKERVTPQDVVFNLSDWHCGTQACFGGHLATWPEFQAMGVKPNSLGAPVCDTGDDRLYPDDISERLFGDAALFKIRECSTYEDQMAAHYGRAMLAGMSDHTLVVKRLEFQIEQLTAQIEEAQ